MQEQLLRSPKGVFFFQFDQVGAAIVQEVQQRDCCVDERITVEPQVNRACLPSGEIWCIQGIQWALGPSLQFGRPIDPLQEHMLPGFGATEVILPGEELFVSGEGNIFTYRKRCRTTDKSTVWVEYSGIVISKDGKLTNSLAVSDQHKDIVNTYNTIPKTWSVSDIIAGISGTLDILLTQIQRMPVSQGRRRAPMSVCG